MRRRRTTLLTLAAGSLVLAAPGPAVADGPDAVPLTKMEHSVRVQTFEQTGKAPTVTRDEVWIASDRSRLVSTDQQGGLITETVYAPEGTFYFQPETGLGRWPAAHPGTQTLREMAAMGCGIGHADTRRLPASKRLGRVVDGYRLKGRGANGGTASWTCWVDRRTRQLLESRSVNRNRRGTTVLTTRVERTELVPRDPQQLALSPAAAALVGSAVPLPDPPAA